MKVGDNLMRQIEEHFQEREKNALTPILERRQKFLEEWIFFTKLEKFNKECDEVVERIGQEKKSLINEICRAENYDTIRHACRKLGIII